MKTLTQLANELEETLDKTAKVNYLLTPKVCPRCQRLLTSKSEIEFLYEVGECARCDHSYGETLHQ